MKTFMRYACPLMMLGFPTLIFAADTLRQLNAKSKAMHAAQIIQGGADTSVCAGGADTIPAIGDIYSSGDRSYRCVIVFNHSHKPVGSAWIKLEAEDELTGWQHAVVLHH